MSLLHINKSKMVPRPYQEAALTALHEHMCHRDTNPCIVLPTGSGKSPVMAWAIRRWKEQHPPFRCAVLAHTKELVHQNADKMSTVWPEADIGVYSAGLRRRDMHNAITFASIDSVFRRATDFDPWDMVFVDEAHRIPARAEGKYRRFIEEAKLNNKGLRVVGMTATPYRMGVGDICHENHVLQEICYEANVRGLIDQGYLCRLRSKVGQHTPDVSRVHKRGGEYIPKELQAAVDHGGIVADAVSELVRIIRVEERQAVIVFCVGVEHCKHVSREFARHGIQAPALTGGTHVTVRDRICRDFKRGSLNVLCNVNVLTEGFDATRLDCIALLRPTESKGLYVQMVGRGLRIDERKEDCLVLDFAGCIERHGPIDAIDAGANSIEVCPECQEAFSRAVRRCPACGWCIPKEKVEAAAAAESERKLHGRKAATHSILSGEPETYEVTIVTVTKHLKADKPDSLKIAYRCGLRTFNEWICLDHEGYAGSKAAGWWRRRFGSKADVPSVSEALQNMFLSQQLTEITRSIQVRKDGRYWKIQGATMKWDTEAEKPTTEKEGVA
jgi:DNA repair protein RadD